MSSKSLDGSRVREYLGTEVEALLATYDQFAKLLPSQTSAGASHRGEDGRYVEALLRSYLRRMLPGSLDVSSGFVMRPAVKTGLNGRERGSEKDSHSRQLDIIVHDSARYPVFQRFADNVIVPPEGVVAVVSVKKHLRGADVSEECAALRATAQLCECLDSNDQAVRGPFLALLAVRAADAPATKPVGEWIFENISRAYQSAEPLPSFDELVGFVGTLDQVSVFKARPEGRPVTSARYVCINHKDHEKHWGLQMILTGILSVYYDPSRNSLRRPGFSGFEPGRKHDADLGELSVAGLRYCRNASKRYTV